MIKKVIKVTFAPESLEEASIFIKVLDKMRLDSENITNLDIGMFKSAVHKGVEKIEEEN